MNKTKHSEKRVRGRMGINKKSINKLMGDAMKRGVAHGMAKGRLHKYFTYLYFKNKTASNIRMYANYVWIFGGTTLFTVFPVPKEHAKSVIKILARNKEATDDTQS